MKHKHYKLDARGEPVPCSMWEWAAMFNAENRIVAKTNIGPSEVSTVFLGLDHNFDGDGPALIWETMVFDGPMDSECDRCGGSREQAEAMHAAMVERVKSSIHNEKV